MTRQEVIKGLECCMITSDDSCKEECPYRGQGDETEYCDEKLIKDAYRLLKAQEPEAVNAQKPDSDIGCWYDITHNYTLEQVVSALKAQEPVVPIVSEEKYGDHLRHCPVCEKVLPNRAVYGKVRFCYYCGVAVKWK